MYTIKIDNVPTWEDNNKSFQLGMSKAFEQALPKQPAIALDLRHNQLGKRQMLNMIEAFCHRNLPQNIAYVDLSFNQLGTITVIPGKSGGLLSTFRCFLAPFTKMQRPITLNLSNNQLELLATHKGPATEMEVAKVLMGTGKTIVLDEGAAFNRTLVEISARKRKQRAEIEKPLSLFFRTSPQIPTAVQKLMADYLVEDTKPVTHRLGSF